MATKTNWIEELNKIRERKQGLQQPTTYDQSMGKMIPLNAQSDNGIQYNQNSQEPITITNDDIVNMKRGDRAWEDQHTTQDPLSTMLSILPQTQNYQQQGTQSPVDSINSIYQNGGSINSTGMAPGLPHPASLLSRIIISAAGKVLFAPDEDLGRKITEINFAKNNGAPLEQWEELDKRYNPQRTWMLPQGVIDKRKQEDLYRIWLATTAAQMGVPGVGIDSAAGSAIMAAQLKGQQDRRTAEKQHQYRMEEINSRGENKKAFDEFATENDIQKYNQTKAKTTQSGREFISKENAKKLNLEKLKSEAQTIKQQIDFGKYILEMATDPRNSLSKQDSFTIDHHHQNMSRQDIIRYIGELSASLNNIKDELSSRD